MRSLKRRGGGCSESTIPPGKLPIGLLDRLVKRYTDTSNGVVVGASIGVDATVIDFSGRYLIAKTDPITFVADDVGLYAICVNANDIAAMGGIPKWFLATILLPEKGTTEARAREIFSQLARACRGMDVAFCGGHTEITFGIDRPIVVGQMLGEVDKKRLITAGDAKAGDDVVITKGIAIEGVSIIARERGEELKGGFPARFIRKCAAFVKIPGISVLKDARIATGAGGVHAMHDPTEGGLATGLYELAAASNVGVEVDNDRIPILPECRRLCDYFSLEPFGLIASGALIIASNHKYTARILRALERAGVLARVIGKVTAKKMGVKIRRDGKLRPLLPFERDEITKIL